MNSIAQKPAPVKTVRTLRWLTKTDTYGLLQIAEGKQVDTYVVLPTAEPNVYEFSKTGTTRRYLVRLQPDGRFVCPCNGCKYHHHCRHGEALVALTARGQLSFAAPAVKSTTKAAS